MAYELRISGWSSDVGSSDRAEHGSALRLALACLCVCGAQRVELFRELDLEAARHRLVIHALAHRVREPGLVEGDAAFGVVVVLVALAVTELLHEPGRRIADMQDRKSTRLNSSH